MTHFTYQDNQLFAEQVSATELAKIYGTPVFVYSRKALEDHFNAYKQAFGSNPHLICYAVKANSNIAVLNVLAQLGAGFDIVSQGELERVLAAGGDPSKVVFSGVGKTTLEMQRALEVGIHCFNVESEAELHTLQDVAAAMDCTANISIRVNPDVDAQTHPYISTGLKENKFGIDIDTAPKVYQTASSLSHINIVGVDCHIGSQLTKLEPFIDAVDRLLPLIDTLSEMGITLSHVDVGGGLGVQYDDETPPSANDYIKAVSEKLHARGLKTFIEPGRSIAANAGIFLTKVLYTKGNDQKNFAVVDGAMNDLIRPTLYGAWQAIRPVNEKATPTPLTYDIVGPICETGDFLGKDRQLDLQQDDLLAIFSAGAYGFGMSSNYNSRNRSAEIMVDGNKHHLIRQRETYEQQMQGEMCLPEV